MTPDQSSSPPEAAGSTASGPAPPAALASVPVSESPRRSSITIPVNLQAPRAARQHVARTLRANGVEDDVRGSVELLISEVVTNVVRHENSLTVDVEATVHPDQAVTVTVTGAVVAPATALAHPAGLSDPSSDRGRGLVILDALSRAWGTRRAEGRTTVWFTVRGADGDAGGAEAVLAEAVPVAEAAEAELIAEPDVVAGRAAVTAERAIDAAVRTAGAAQSARLARAVAATLAAEAVAETAARTMQAVQLHADELAVEVARAAELAAATVASSILRGGDAAAARAALQVEATVLSAAVAKSEETARAAVLVAREVAAAAAAVAATTSAAAAAVEIEVSDAAVAVQAVTAATAQQLASDAYQRGAALAQAAREAAAASERLRVANEQLLRAGRHDRSIAVALQAAMLTQLPESDELTLAARYLTAAEHDQVGGDWYDALVLPSRSTTLVIGDVIGHDIAAAAVMGQLRNLLRSLVWDRDEPPSAVVARLDRAIRDLRIDTIATLVVVSVEPPSPAEAGGICTLRWTNAGHPAPILIHADGTVITLDESNDILLGVEPNTVRRDHSCAVPRGATLLLYTDGLVETRHSGIDAGHERLLAALHEHHRLEPSDLLDAVLAETVGDHPDDDVAVLAVRFDGPVRPAAR